MNLSEQFWLSIGINGLFGIVFIAMMKQQLKDLVEWVKDHDADIDDLRDGQKDHEGRISHVEGRLGMPRKGD